MFFTEVTFRCVFIAIRNYYVVVFYIVIHLMSFNQGQSKSYHSKPKDVILISHTKARELDMIILRNHAPQAYMS